MEKLFEHDNLKNELISKDVLMNLTGSTAKVGGWILDTATLKQTWTEETYKIYEVEFDFDPNLDNGINFYSPKSKPIIESAMKRAIEFGESFDHELEVITRNGNRKWVHSIGKVFEEDGIYKKVFGSVQDITERKTAEIYREMSKKVLMILSGRGNFIEEIHDTIKIIRGAVDVDAVGMRLQDGEDYPYFFSEGFPTKFLEKENSIISRDRIGGICRNSDGKVSLECTCGLVISGKTDPTNSLFTKGGSSWTNNSFPFLDLSLDDDPRTNPRNLCIHHGYASVALIPIRANNIIIGLLQLNSKRKNCFTLYGIELLEAIAENIGEAFLRKKAETELENYKNQLEDLVKSRTKELEEANHLLKLDTEKQKEYELLLKESLRKEIELSSIKSNLISTASHEFRTPLMSILSSTELLQRFGNKWDTDKKDEHVEKIKRNVHHLTKLLDDVLLVYKYENEKLEFHPKLLNLSILLQECIDDSRLLTNNSYEISYDFSCKQKDFVVDGKLMRFIADNLISNAIKFTPIGKKIELRISCDENNISIEVTDNGIGIPSDEIDKIFVPFYKASNADIYIGTGIGLTIVERSVELHGGKITVQSSLGEGTKFTVLIPLIDFEKD